MTKIEEWAARAVDNGTVWPEAICNAADLANSFKAMLAEAQADGWKMVPTKITPEMNTAGHMAYFNHNENWLGHVMEAANAAAPDVTEEP